MTHVADIEDALDLDDIRAIEAAFRALVDFPNEEDFEGAATVDTLASLLGRVTLALQHDQSVMPTATCRLIACVVDDLISTSATYAHGARIVSNHPEYWRDIFLKHMSERGAA